MALVHPESERMAYFEDILIKIGHGIFFNYMIGIASASSFSRGMACLTMSFAVPLALCSAQMSENSVLTVFLSFILGKALGGAVYSCACDVYGRKIIYLWSLLTIFGAHFLAAFSFGYGTFHLSGFILGSGIEGSATSMKIMLAEILLPNKRGMYIMFTELFWTFGYFLLALLTLKLTETSGEDSRQVDLHIASWRVIFALSGGINIITACASSLIEESPRFLLYIRKKRMALYNIRQYYAINRSNHGDGLSIVEQDLGNLIAEDEERNPSQNACYEFFKLPRKMVKSISILLQKRFRKPFLAVICIGSSLSIGLLYLNIVLAKLLASNGDIFITGTEIVYLDEPKCANFTYLPSTGHYNNFFGVASTLWLSQFILMLSVDRLGRKIPTFIGLAFAGISSILLAFIRSTILRWVNALTLMFSFSLAQSSTNIVILESFPTHLRGMVFGYITFVENVIACLIVSLINVSSWIFLITLGSSILCASLASYFLPELKNHPMTE